MKKLGAAVVFAVVACALPAYAQGASQNSGSENQCCVSRNQNGVSQNDVTGAIDSRAQPQGGVAAIESAPPSAGLAPIKPALTYEDAFRDWRNCAATHQGFGNPPPQCEDLRLALRKAIAMRPRNEAKK